MALTEFSHHASRGQTRARAREGVEHEEHVGLRAQKPPLPGKRPEPLEEVSEPQVEVFSLLAEFFSPAPAVSWSLAPVVESVTHVPASSPVPVVDYLAPAPAVFLAPVPTVEYLAPAPAVSESPAPVVEHISPALAGLFPAPVVE